MNSSKWKQTHTYKNTETNKLKIHYWLNKPPGTGRRNQLENSNGGICGSVRNNQNLNTAQKVGCKKLVWVWDITLWNSQQRKFEMSRERAQLKLWLWDERRRWGKMKSWKIQPAITNWSLLYYYSVQIANLTTKPMDYNISYRTNIANIVPNNKIKSLCFLS